MPRPRPSRRSTRPKNKRVSASTRKNPGVRPTRRRNCPAMAQGGVSTGELAAAGGASPEEIAALEVGIELADKGFDAEAIGDKIGRASCRERVLFEV